MTDDREFDERDFAKHVANVCQDVADHMVTPDEATEAILEHPVAKAAARLNLCRTCGKPSGYRGYLGPECMCDKPTGSALKGAPSVGTQR